jgi:hypothetical protein
MKTLHRKINILIEKVQLKPKHLKLTIKMMKRKQQIRLLKRKKVRLQFNKLSLHSLDKKTNKKKILRGILQRVRNNKMLRKI